MTVTARTYTAFLALASAGAFALPAVAEEMKFMAELTGAAQVPPVETEGMGLADVTVDTEAMTISWMVLYVTLSGEPVAGHFHGPAMPEETAPPVIDLTVDMEGAETTTETATDSTEEAVPMDIMEGSSELTEEQMADLEAGLLYINIHTPEHPDGEIRGQVMAGVADLAAMEAMRVMEESEMQADAAAQGDAMLGGEAIRAAISGNTVQGNMLDSGAYSEFYAADGVIKGDGYTGTWTIEGDAMCFDYGEEEATCWQVRLEGDQITWVQDDADLGDGTILPGNPNSF